MTPDCDIHKHVLILFICIYMFNTGYSESDHIRSKSLRSVKYKYGDVMQANFRFQNIPIDTTYNFTIYNADRKISTSLLTEGKVVPITNEFNSTTKLLFFSIKYGTPAGLECKHVDLFIAEVIIGQITIRDCLSDKVCDITVDLEGKCEKDLSQSGTPKSKPEPMNIGMLAGIGVSTVVIISSLAVFSLYWRKRRGLVKTTKASATTSESVVYAQLLIPESTSNLPRIKIDNTPYAQVIGVLAPQKTSK